MFELGQRVIWHTRRHTPVGRVIENRGEGYYLVEFNNGRTHELHDSEIGAY